MNKNSQSSKARFILSDRIGDEVLEKLKKDFDGIKQLSQREHYLMKKTIIRSVLDVLEERL